MVSGQISIKGHSCMQPDVFSTKKEQSETHGSMAQEVEGREKDEGR